MLQALVVSLALATVSPAPASAASHDDDFPWGALVPLGFTAGYLYEGRLDRVLLGGAGIYALGGAGLVIGWGMAVDNLTWKDPLGSAMGLVLSPIGGTMIGLGIGGGLAMVDQAFYPHFGGPFAAPAVSLGAAALLTVPLLLQGEAPRPVVDKAGARR